MVPKPEETIDTVTFRIPSSLKSALDAAAKLRGETATAILRTALEDALGGDRRRVHELPGFTSAFADFLSSMKKRAQPYAALLVQGREGNPRVFEGGLNFNYTDDGVVAIDKRDKTYVLPRGYIVGWYGGDANAVKRMTQTLAAGGMPQSMLNS
jgi:hypothetical protein